MFYCRIPQYVRILSPMLCTECSELYGILNGLTTEKSIVGGGGGGGLGEWSLWVWPLPLRHTRCPQKSLKLLWA